MMRALRTLLFSGLTLCALTQPAIAQREDPTAAAALGAWQGLSKGDLSRCPESFPYFPQSGPQQVACYLLSLPGISLLLRLAPPVFRAGPHRSTGEEIHYDVAHPSLFGHYNPAFVRWGLTNILPLLTQRALVAQSQEHYDAKLKPFLRALFITRQKIDAEPECFSREVGDYQNYLRARTADSFAESDHVGLPTERYFYFMNPRFCSHPQADFQYFYARGFAGGHDGNIIKGCVSWWIRRSIDGTAPLFQEGLTRLIRAYDPELIAASEEQRTSSEEQAGARAVLERFERGVLSHQPQQVLTLMGERYIREQHDRFLRGNTAQFIEELFCGEQEQASAFHCLRFASIDALNQISLKKAPRGSWSVLYAVTGASKRTRQQVTIRVELTLIEEQGPDQSIRYRIVGAVG